jgi:hypothetical protein
MVCDDKFKMSPEEDKDLQEYIHFRKLREEMAALPPNVINPATGLPIEFGEPDAQL